jgi:hypothetical protein
MKEENTFKALMKREALNIPADLEAGGHLEGCTPENAEAMDWLRVILETTADIALEARFDTSDPEANLAVRRKLAKLTAICVAWDTQLDG